MRLCRELCFSRFRKKTADWVWERVRGLDNGGKPAGSAEIRENVKGGGIHTHTHAKFNLSG